MHFDLQTLIDKLNPTCRKALELAAELCLTQTNYNVEIEHLLLKLSDLPNTDFQRLLRYYEVRTADVASELTRAIETFKRGNSRAPALSPHIVRLLEHAWMMSSLHLGESKVSSGSILLALLDHNALRGIILESCLSLRAIPREVLLKDLPEIIRASEEDGETVSTPDGQKTIRPSPESGHTSSKTPSLDQYTIDLTARARSDQIDPVQCREFEIRQIIDILTRRRQNNPILTGEAGVGKTAVVEGFAIRIAKGDVPPSVKNISLRLLDLGLLQAGAGIKGEFEKRLKSVIEEVKSSPQPIILFIDEAHTMIGAGGPAGMGDAANLLKPALARGELRTIAATTWSEYKKYFEKDPALARRFQVVKVDEPDEDSAVEMLRGVVSNLESHHKVTVLDEAVRDAVRLSLRYISGRQLPDKAISVLDTACARVAVGQNSTPPEIEDVVRRIEQSELEVSILRKERATGQDHAARIEELTGELEIVKRSKKELEVRLQKELTTVEKILGLQKTLEKQEDGEKGSKKNTERLVKELNKLKKELESLQEDEPMVPVCVDSRVIASVVSGWTGIPVGKMLTDEIQMVLSLKEKMEERIIGQSQALDAICRRIQTYRADLDDPGKPVGVFLLVGPSGSGKTETAIAISDILYGGERNMTVINMSEYQEPYTVSGLKGSPPGYVGYGKGGVLTEAVRRNPYSVVLLDEVEKAHPDVMELFYQVFDKGTMEDAEGVVIDFKNTIILLTSNVGSEVIMKALSSSQTGPDAKAMIELIRPALLKYFKPALLGRLVIVPYYPLDDKVIQKIARLKLEKIQQRFLENHRLELTYGEDLISAIAARCTEVDTGARNLSRELLNRMALCEPCTSIHVYLDRDGGFAYRSAPSSPLLNMSQVEKMRSSSLLDWSSPRKLSSQARRGHRAIKKKGQKRIRKEDKKGASKKF
ncbi:MAG: type VI secretion system ATPase TssH, partial [Deltaproteobacteria bacterium]|nr:type VI secretion system ATPase TssH [Deltaproteobacteria bacterium]